MRTTGLVHQNVKLVPQHSVCNVTCNRLVPPGWDSRQLATAGNAIKFVNRIRGGTLLVAGASKDSLYTQLPERLDEPTPGFDSIASALEDLAAGECGYMYFFPSSTHQQHAYNAQQRNPLSTVL